MSLRAAVRDRESLAVPPLPLYRDRIAVVTFRIAITGAFPLPVHRFVVNINPEMSERFDARGREGERE